MKGLWASHLSGCLVEDASVIRSHSTEKKFGYSMSDLLDYAHQQHTAVFRGNYVIMQQQDQSE